MNERHKNEHKESLVESRGFEWGKQINSDIWSIFLTFLKNLKIDKYEKES
jgi:hypothetical protein